MDLFHELHQIRQRRNASIIIETHGSNIILSVLNLLDLIRETYDEGTACTLERRFYASIKDGSVDKFKRSASNATKQ